MILLTNYNYFGFTCKLKSPSQSILHTSFLTSQNCHLSIKSAKASFLLDWKETFIILGFCCPIISSVIVAWNICNQSYIRTMCLMINGVIVFLNIKDQIPLHRSQFYIMLFISTSKLGAFKKKISHK